MVSGYIGGVFDSAVFDCAVFDCGTFVSIKDKKSTRRHDERLFQQILYEDEEILEFVLTVVTSGILEK